MEHSDENVNLALIRLNDALCNWERVTTRTSCLILREAGGFEHRSCSGKPLWNSNQDVSDDQLMSVEAPDTYDASKSKWMKRP